MLECRALTKKYGSKLALDGVTLSLSAGHVYGLMGPNGSGKSTWMKSAAGLVLPTSGSMLLDGVQTGVASREKIAYMSTEPYFYSWMTVRDAGRYYADFFRDFSYDRYRELLEEMELTEKPKIRTFSTGMTAKLKIAITLARDAEVYMLDEPFNGIDLLARDSIRETILAVASPAKLLILSSHLVEEMDQVADTAIFLKSGKLIEVCDLAELHTREGQTLADRYRAIYGQKGVAQSC